MSSVETGQMSAVETGQMTARRVPCSSPEGVRSFKVGGGGGLPPPNHCISGPRGRTTGGGRGDQDRELENHTPRLVTPEGVGGRIFWPKSAPDGSGQPSGFTRREV